MHFSRCSREPLRDCLKDVDLIPPFNRMLLEVTFGKLYTWAIQNIRNILLEASVRFKELGTPAAAALYDVLLYYYFPGCVHITSSKRDKSDLFSPGLCGLKNLIFSNPT